MRDSWIDREELDELVQAFSPSRKKAKRRDRTSRTSSRLPATPPRQKSTPPATTPPPESGVTEPVSAPEEKSLEPVEAALPVVAEATSADTSAATEQPTPPEPQPEEPGQEPVPTATQTETPVPDAPAPVHEAVAPPVEPTISDTPVAGQDSPTSTEISLESPPAIPEQPLQEVPEPPGEAVTESPHSSSDDEWTRASFLLDLPDEPEEPALSGEMAGEENAHPVRLTTIFEEDDDDWEDDTEEDWLPEIAPPHREAAEALRRLAETRRQADENALLKKTGDPLPSTPPPLPQSAILPESPPALATPASPMEEWVDPLESFGPTGSLLTRLAQFSETVRESIGAISISVVDEDGYLLCFQGEESHDMEGIFAKLGRNGRSLASAMGLGDTVASQAADGQGVWYCVIHASQISLRLKLEKPLSEPMTKSLAQALHQTIHPDS